MAGAFRLLEASFAPSDEIIANRFVKLTAEDTVETNDTNGAWCPGVALSDVSTSNEFGIDEVTNGKMTAVQMEGVAWVETLADLTGSIGDPVASENDGTVISAGTCDQILGRLMSEGDGSGATSVLVLVKLQAEGTSS
jgi:hypothetical protein